MVVDYFTTNTMLQYYFQVRPTGSKKHLRLLLSCTSFNCNKAGCHTAPARPACEVCFVRYIAIFQTLTCRMNSLLRHEIVPFFCISFYPGSKGFFSFSLLLVLELRPFLNFMKLHWVCQNFKLSAHTLYALVMRRATVTFALDFFICPSYFALRFAITLPWCLSFTQKTFSFFFCCRWLTFFFFC